MKVVESLVSEYLRLSRATGGDEWSRQFWGSMSRITGGKPTCGHPNGTIMDGGKGPISDIR